MFSFILNFSNKFHRVEVEGRFVCLSDSAVDRVQKTDFKRESAYLTQTQTTQACSKIVIWR